MTEVKEVKETFEQEKGSRRSRVPANALECIDNYVTHKIPPGGFVQTVLENNLLEAMSRADYHNSCSLRDIVNYIYWHVPAIAWGSPEKVRDWLSKR